MKKIAAAGLLCIGLSGTAISAEPTEVTDGRVNGLNARTYDALQRINQASRASGIISAQAARFLGQEIVADQQMDPVETDLLLELTQDRSRLVKVSKENAHEEVVTFGTTSGETRKILRDLLLPQKTLEILLTSGPAGWKEVALLSERSPSDADDVQKYVQQHLASLWRQSNLDNKYLPLRDFLKQADIDMKTLPEAVYKSARSVLYQSVVQVDADLLDSIPNAFYSWLKLDVSVDPTS